MTLRALARGLRRGPLLLQHQAELTLADDAAMASCRSLSSAATDLPSRRTSRPQLPCTLRTYRKGCRAPLSLSVEALDRQLHRDDPDVVAWKRAAAALDNAAVQHAVGIRQLSLGQTNTVRLLSRSNVGVPYLRGQSILAKVLSADSVRVVVDTGYHGLAEVPRCDVSLTHIHAPNGDASASRSSTTDIRAGDVLRLRVDATYTPYGDMQLSPVQEDTEQQRRAVWNELYRRMGAMQPVKGRVLNECPGGYAVGVAGYTALLPAALAATATVKLVGVPQEFFIAAMDGHRRMLTLRDPGLEPRSYKRGAGGAGY